jgi:HK97 family phage prohead protease
VLRFDDGPNARTIVACICPFLGEIAVVDDGAGAYSEAFISGIFAQQIKEAQSRPLRVWLDIAHRKDAVIGHAVRLRELESGLYGEFAVHGGLVGDKALAAVRKGELNGVSVTFTPLCSRTVDGVTRRQKSHRVGVALVPGPAYPNATVVGIRRTRRDEQPGPASADEFNLWELERLDGKLRALQMQYTDEALEMRAERRRAGRPGRSYTTDPRLQTVAKLPCEIAEQRAALQASIAPRAAVDKALRPPVIHRDCGEVLAI